MVGVRREEAIGHIGAIYQVYIHRDSIMVTSIQCDLMVAQGHIIGQQNSAHRG
jgi:hypothetical protein